jgi:hypothetical protein
MAAETEVEEMDSFPEESVAVVGKGQGGALVPHGGHIDAIIAVAEKMEALGTALDRIRNFAMKRAMPGDWVRFKGKDDDGTLNLAGPGAERIAAAVGVSFIEWKAHKEEGRDEKGPWYRWYYNCTALAMGRRLEAIEGHAGSRDRFFGIKYGKLKDLSDVSEADIRTAARRNAMKEGVRILLGLRRLPIETAKELGLNLAHIKTVEFEDNKPSATKEWKPEAKPAATPAPAAAGATTTAAAPAAAAKPAATPAEGTFDKVVEFVGVKVRTTKAGKQVFVLETTEGGPYDTFSETQAGNARDSVGSGVKFHVTGTSNRFGNTLKTMAEVSNG